MWNSINLQHQEADARASREGSAHESENQAPWSGLERHLLWRLGHPCSRTSLYRRPRERRPAFVLARQEGGAGRQRRDLQSSGDSPPICRTLRLPDGQRLRSHPCALSRQRHRLPGGHLRHLCLRPLRRREGCLPDSPRPHRRDTSVYRL